MDTRTIYSPVRAGADGSVTVDLSEEHPGFADRAYRARRDAIAALSHDWTTDRPVPHVEYSAVEHDVWRIVNRELTALYRERAASRFLDAVDALALPTDHVPQLTEVTDRLASLSHFRYGVVAGLAPLRTFYDAFADGMFFSTQYIRHHSTPLYTPEPDIVHEVLGHAPHLGDPETARLYRMVGEAVRRVATDDALRLLSKVFWFTFEFGVVEEDGALKTYGAGILSSFGELSEFQDAAVQPLDFGEMCRIEYDITKYQPVLFKARSMRHAYDEIEGFLESFGDETPQRLAS
ncbi:MAG: phenylalanine 4-monooxygenase [Actinomycetota bacterium]